MFDYTILHTYTQYIIQFVYTIHILYCRSRWYRKKKIHRARIPRPWLHGRRIITEEKAKVVATVWGAEFVHVFATLDV